MSFFDEWQRLDWEALSAQIARQTPRDVERALGRRKRDLNDFAALISPAAEAFLLPMAEQAQALTRQRFGQGMQMYLPLYLANLCANDCSYCGFSMSNKLKRRVLSAAEVEAECRVIRDMGYKTLLLVTGEHESKTGMAYFREIMPVVKPHVGYLMMEVQPLATDEYRELIQLGLDGVMVYQETYHAPTYAEHHLRGKKQDMRWRLETPDRLGQAGIDKIGLGALLGLADWRVDSLMVAHHLAYLRRHYWQSRYSLSFPRLRPCTGGFQPGNPMSDRQLVQLICAYRLLDAELELSLSTREAPAFRDQLMSLGITSLSAGSKTQPGGYAEQRPELEQFAVSDERSAAEVAQAIRGRGLEVIWHEASPAHLSGPRG